MGQTTRPDQPVRTTQATVRPDERREPGFKPLALPALAAAVHVSHRRTERPVKRDVPAILREEAVLG